MCEKCKQALALRTVEDENEVKDHLAKIGSKLLKDFEAAGYCPAFAMCVWASAIGYMDDQMGDTQRMVLDNMRREYYTASVIDFVEMKHNLKLDHARKERIN